MVDQTQTLLYLETCRKNGVEVVIGFWPLVLRFSRLEAAQEPSSR
ncbi:MAG: hypothetical protein EDM05_63335 [Leptolyngbya sp. IPPAS B-1204]